jgi:hypothetical protein
MYKLFVLAMLVAAFSPLGISTKDFENCHSRRCVKMSQNKALDVLRIEWRPISVFPEEARWYRDARESPLDRQKFGLDLNNR